MSYYIGNAPCVDTESGRVTSIFMVRRVNGQEAEENKAKDNAKNIWAAVQTHTCISTSGTVNALNPAFREFWPLVYNKHHIQNKAAGSTGVFTCTRTESVTPKLLGKSRLGRTEGYERISLRWNEGTYVVRIELAQDPVQ
jgi:hypothetical protein